MTKTCKRCGCSLPEAYFSAHRETRDKLHPWCKPCMAVYQSERRAATIEHRRKWERDYSRSNPERSKAKSNRVWLRRKSSPKGRLENSIRCRVWQVLANVGSDKGGRTFDLLGYSVEELMSHLEAKFVEGMSWDNYGDWHVDHVRPLCTFSYSSNSDQSFKAAWALDNLQPLWALDNLTKSKSFNGYQGEEVLSVA